MANNWARHPPAPERDQDHTLAYHWLAGSRACRSVRRTGNSRGRLPLAAHLSQIQVVLKTNPHAQAAASEDRITTKWRCGDGRWLRQTPRGRKSLAKLVVDEKKR